MKTFKFFVLSMMIMFGASSCQAQFASVNPTQNTAGLGNVMYVYLDPASTVPGTIYNDGSSVAYVDVDPWDGIADNNSGNLDRNYWIFTGIVADANGNRTNMRINFIVKRESPYHTKLINAGYGGLLGVTWYVDPRSQLPQLIGSRGVITHSNGYSSLNPQMGGTQYIMM